MDGTSVAKVELEAESICEGHTVIFSDEEWLVDEPVVVQLRPANQPSLRLLHMHMEIDPTQRVMLALERGEKIFATKFRGRKIVRSTC